MRGLTGTRSVTVVTLFARKPRGAYSSSMGGSSNPAMNPAGDRRMPSRDLHIDRCKNKPIPSKGTAQGHHLPRYIAVPDRKAAADAHLLRYLQRESTPTAAAITSDACNVSHRGYEVDRRSPGMPPVFRPTLTVLTGSRPRCSAELRALPYEEIAVMPQGCRPATMSLALKNEKTPDYIRNLMAAALATAHESMWPCQRLIERTSQRETGQMEGRRLIGSRGCGRRRDWQSFVRSFPRGPRRSDVSYKVRA